MKTALLALILLLAAPPLPAVELTAVYPQIAYAGSPVTLIGGPFGPEIRIDLAGRLLRPSSIGPRQLVFLAPPLPVGDYALFLRDGEQTSPQTFSLRIELPPPVINALVPDRLDECATPEQRQVSLRGAAIQSGAQLLLDGAVIPFSHEDEQSLSFTPTPLRAGSYGLQLVNPDGKKSLPHTLWISNLPEIESVSEGENFVNYYQVLIRGKNFFHNSVLLISEYPGGFDDLPPRQRFIPAQGSAAFSGDRARLSQSENLRYQDCHTLVYNRYPATGQAIRLVLRIGNPDGQQSEPFEVSLP
jgi:hypothetical protein